MISSREQNPAKRSVTIYFSQLTTKKNVGFTEIRSNSICCEKKTKKIKASLAETIYTMPYPCTFRVVINLFVSLSNFLYVTCPIIEVKTNFKAEMKPQLLSYYRKSFHTETVIHLLDPKM